MPTEIAQSRGKRSGRRSFNTESKGLGEDSGEDPGSVPTRLVPLCLSGFPVCEMAAFCFS